MKHIVKTKNGGLQKVQLTPMRAIRIFCLECVGYSAKEVRRCDSDLCPLWPYRMGATPAGRQALREQGELPSTTGADGPAIAFPAAPADREQPISPQPEPVDDQPAAETDPAPAEAQTEATPEAKPAGPQPGLFDG